MSRLKRVAAVNSVTSDEDFIQLNIGQMVCCGEDDETIESSIESIVKNSSGLYLTLENGNEFTLDDFLDNKISLSE